MVSFVVVVVVWVRSNSSPTSPPLEMAWRMPSISRFSSLVVGLRGSSSLSLVMLLRLMFLSFAEEEASTSGGLERMMLEGYDEWVVANG